MPLVTVIAPGNMGAAIGQRLVQHGLHVLTSLSGRSGGSADRARDAGMEDCDDIGIAASDLILSIVPPGDAVGLAQRLAPALAQSATKPTYVDCNAVSPETAKRIGFVIDDTGCPFVDAGIIGPPPRMGYCPAIYASGPAVAGFARLNDYGLKISVMDGPVGMASALKLSYAGISKGTLALGTAMLLAADRAGVAEVLVGELAASQPMLLQLFARNIPGTYSKAYRWVAEMQEIATFADSASPGADAIYRGIASLYEALTADAAGEHGMTDALDRSLPSSRV